MVKINTKTTSRMPIWEFLWTIHPLSKTTVTKKYIKNKQNQPFRGPGNCPKSMQQMKKHLFKKIEYISVKTAKSVAFESQPAPCPRKLPSGWVQAGMQGFLSPNWSFQGGSPPAFLIPHLCVAKALKQTRAAKRPGVHFFHQAPAHWAEVLP